MSEDAIEVLRKLHAWARSPNHRYWERGLPQSLRALLGDVSALVEAVDTGGQGEVREEWGCRPSPTHVDKAPDEHHARMWAQLNEGRIVRRTVTTTTTPWREVDGHDRADGGE